jgi:hypothetical protein
MKAATILLIITTTFFSCKKDNPIQERDISSCSFGVENPNPFKRFSPKGRPPRDIVPQTPSDSGVIFIDMDGHTTRGTVWNYNGDIVSPHSGLTDSEMIGVIEVAKNDYAGLKVIITGDSTRYWAAPQNKRVRVVVTSLNWYNPQYGGVAYTNSFTWGDNTPCFIFSGSLNYNVVNIGKVVSHETGHTCGLKHQAECANGTSVNNYRNGVIMGQTINYPEATWIVGPTPYCVTQDDLRTLNNTFN